MAVLKLTLDVVELMMISKNKKIKVWGGFYGSFWVISVQGGGSFFNFFKGGQLKKSLGNPGL